MQNQTSEGSQKYLNRILTFEERGSSDSSATGRFSLLCASSSIGAESFCATGDSFSLYALSRFGLVLGDPLIMNCPGFRAPSLPFWEVDFSALVNLKQTNKQRCPLTLVERGKKQFCIH